MVVITSHLAIIFRLLSGMASCSIRYEPQRLVTSNMLGFALLCQFCIELAR
jgi:hypothetical protein